MGISRCAVKPSPKRFVAERHIGEAVELGRGYKARTPQAFFWRSMARGHSVRSFLLFDILLDNFQRCSSARGRKIAPTPEHVLPVPPLKFWKLLPKETAGNAFQAVRKRRQGNFRWEINQQMHMIRFAVELGKFITRRLRKRVRISRASPQCGTPSNTRRRYFGVKIRWACRRKTQWRPERYSVAGFGMIQTTRHSIYIVDTYCQPDGVTYVN